MKTAREHLLVLVTAPNRSTGRALARAVLGARLAACVNILPSIESHYWWKGKIECAKEVLLLCKTRRACLQALEQTVLKEHPYDTPEVVALSFASGSARYLAWITQNCRNPVRVRSG